MGKPARMHPVELGVYATVVGAALAHLTWSGYHYSLQFEAGGKWDGYAPGLRQGWLLGRRADLSDTQWREFRAALPALGAAFAAFAALARAVPRWAPPRRAATARAAAYVAFAAAFLLHLHGAFALHVFALVAANRALARAVAGRRYGAWAIWGCNVAAFLAARVTEGLPFALVLGPRAAWLDSHRGALRWHICYNLTVLRMLSYALDLHWARLARAAARGPAAAVAAAAAPRTPRERQRCELPSEADYGLLPCLAHALYPPLYLAGPIISFQDFAWQLRGPPPPPAAAADGSASAAAAPTSAAAAAVLRYALRLAADLACLEAVTHFLYFNSLAVHRVGARYAAHGLAHGAPQVGLAAWWVLTFMWLKFATIWRTTRLAALAAGVEAPENMVRCFADNYEVEGFWRGWHASYNRWLVRYMYVPMGGGARRALTIWPIFLFVALWHDLDWRLLSWAWLACLAFLPEMAAKRAAAAPRFDAVRGGAGFRALAAAAAALNIAGLMGANMVGFVVGADGAAALVRQLAAAPAYVAAALAAFFCAAQLMFALRAREAGSKAA